MTRKEWLVAAILTFITICAWVIFDILHTRSKVEISPKLQEITQPINADFNLKPIQDR